MKLWMRILIVAAVLQSLVARAVVERAAIESGDSPLCKLDADAVMERINKKHQFNIVGIDDKFKQFARDHITKDDSKIKDQDSDWAYEYVSVEDDNNDSRKRHLAADDGDSEFKNKRMCKMVRVLTKRFDKVPFVKVHAYCQKNPHIQGINYECENIVEERHILRLNEEKPCNSLRTAAEEEWVHSTEKQVVGCEAVLKYKRAGKTRT